MEWVHGAGALVYNSVQCGFAWTQSSSKSPWSQPWTVEACIPRTWEILRILQRQCVKGANLADQLQQSYWFWPCKLRIEGAYWKSLFAHPSVPFTLVNLCFSNLFMSMRAYLLQPLHEGCPKQVQPECRTQGASRLQESTEYMLYNVIFLQFIYIRIYILYPGTAILRELKISFGNSMFILRGTHVEQQLPLSP